MNTIITKNLEKVYQNGLNQVCAVDGVNLEIKPGEFTAIVGPSGSGKTTLLNMIGGLDKPTAGEVYIGSTCLQQLSEKELVDFRLNHIGFVFQAYNLIPVLTAQENVSFIMELQGKSSKEVDKRALEILDEVGLSLEKNRRPDQLSGGQQQRVAVARAMASRPTFIIADEPTANLDSKTTARLLEMMEEMNARENVTFLFSTHDERVMKKAHRIIVLEDGKIVEDKVVR